MRVAGIQLDIAWEQPGVNYDRLRPWVAAAATAGARLVVLPEMFACGFSMNTSAIAEPVDGASVQFLRAMAKEHNVWIAGSVPEKAADKPFNTLVLAAPAGDVHRYRKIHPFSYAKEHEHYGAGTEHVTVDVDGVRCTLFVCYDLRFADEFWACARGTDCYVVVANWPMTRRHHWTSLLRARAIENQAYVVGVNRVGTGGSLEYAGDSRIYDPMGNALATAAERETMVLAEIDPRAVAEVRAKFPFLQDRR
jgi:predicted amidohydrolase